MRTLVLLFVLAAPSLMFCCAARAAASAGIGKPVCTHYDESSSKATDGHASAAASGASAVSGGSAPSSGGLSQATTAKSGGSASEMRAHTAPRWQAFLPGMFR